MTGHSNLKLSGRELRAGGREEEEHRQDPELWDDLHASSNIRAPRKEEERVSPLPISPFPC